STAAFDSRKRSAILATAAALSGLAMAILPVVVPPVASSAPERREPRAEAGLGNHGMARGLRLAPALAPLSGTSVPPAGQGGTTGGLWYAGHGTCSGPPRQVQPRSRQGVAATKHDRGTGISTCVPAAASASAGAAPPASASWTSGMTSAASSSRSGASAATTA